MKNCKQEIKERTKNLYLQLIKSAPEGCCINSGALWQIEECTDPLIAATADDGSAEFFVANRFGEEIMPSVASVTLSSPMLEFDSPQKLSLLAKAIENFPLGCEFKAENESRTQLSFDFLAAYAILFEE